MATEKQLEAFAQYIKTVLGPRAKLVKPYTGTKQNPSLIHISTDGKIKEFIPMVSKRTAKAEDRTVPRVSTAPHLLGCINGYAATVEDFLGNWKCDWEGGYYIYDVPYAVAGSPEAELLYDVGWTDEKWIVPFDPKHRSIEPKKLGKLILVSVHIENAKDTNRIWSPTFFVQVTDKTPVFLTATVALTQGYWRVQIDSATDTAAFSENSLSFSEISRTEFMAVKKVTAGLLSYEATAPSDSW
jgi:hypothetical protein